MSADYVFQILWARCMFKKITPRQSWRVCLIQRQNSRYFDVRYEIRNVDKRQTYMKTETCKLYSSVFWIFLPYVIKIDPYNFELYRFKFGAFFDTQCNGCVSLWAQRWQCIVLRVKRSQTLHHAYRCDGWKKTVAIYS